MYQLTDFLTEPQAKIPTILANALSRLSSTTTPQWGTLTPQLMVEHLALVQKVCLKADADVTVRPGATKDFIYTDRPIAHNIPSGVSHPQPYYADLETAKAELNDAVARFYAADPNAPMRAHPAFGSLAYADWERFHRKHIYHHFLQFGLWQ